MQIKNLLSVKKRSTKNKNNGFTLIEILVVIGVLATLLTITLVAINPTKILNRSKLAQKESDVNTILNALYQYKTDHGGNLPPGVNTPTISLITNYPSFDGVDICNDLVPEYIAKLPIDPSLREGGTLHGDFPDNSFDCSGNYFTGYLIIISTSGRIIVLSYLSLLDGTAPTSQDIPIAIR